MSDYHTFLPFMCTCVTEGGICWTCVSVCRLLLTKLVIICKTFYHLLTRPKTLKRSICKRGVSNFVAGLFSFVWQKRFGDLLLPPSKTWVYLMFTHEGKKYFWQTTTPISLSFLRCSITCCAFYILLKLPWISARFGFCLSKSRVTSTWSLLSYLSHRVSIQEAVSQKKRMKMSSVRPGYLFISTFRTKRKVKLMLLREPMLL